MITPLSVSPLQIVNDDERRFYVCLVRKNEYHGTDQALLHQEDEPIIEFFDASSLNPEEEELGYYTGIRCGISTLFATAFERGGSADRLFNEDLPMWNISNENVRAIREWLLRHLQEGEKDFLDANSLKILSRWEEEPEQTETCIIDPKESTDAPSPLQHIMPLRRDEENKVCAHLENALHTLDEAERAAPHWQSGNVDIRLHILEAKKRLLQALALLE